MKAKHHNIIGKEDGKLQSFCINTGMINKNRTTRKSTFVTLAIQIF